MNVYLGYASKKWTGSAVLYEKDMDLLDVHPDQCLRIEGSRRATYVSVDKPTQDSHYRGRILLSEETLKNVSASDNLDMKVRVSKANPRIAQTVTYHAFPENIDREYVEKNFLMKRFLSVGDELRVPYPQYTTILVKIISVKPKTEVFTIDPEVTRFEKDFRFFDV